MTKVDKRKVADCVESEGFDYCFRFYSTFDEIADPRFHELRVAYVEAGEQLAAYVGVEE